MNIQLKHRFEDIVSMENLLEAWQEFVRGKRMKRDVQEFSLHLIDNILALHADLVNGSYRHGGYHAFNISDPKPRNIHKASVRDRLIHHAIYRILYSFFDRTFIADSFSCRLEKGTHRALDRFRLFFRKVSKNNTRTCWILKCDIKKFFANIDHAILMRILGGYIPDQKILGLLRNIIESFSSARPRVGLPLGNLTSQLLVNIYMNEFDRAVKTGLHTVPDSTGPVSTARFDQFVKHRLKSKYYIRYADDFVLLSQNKQWLEMQLPLISDFLSSHLKLALHPDKVFMKTVASGVDFLGWVHFPDHRVLRSATKRRMMKRIKKNPSVETTASYLGLLQHGNTEKLRREIFENFTQT